MVLGGVLDSKRTIQIGIRADSDYPWELYYDSEMTAIHAEAITCMGLDQIMT